MARGKFRGPIALGRTAALLCVGGALLSGCTKILGIDGDYDLVGRSGGGATLGNGGAGGSSDTDAASGGVSGSGGTAVDTGGASAGGTVVDSGVGGTPPGAGGAPEDAGCASCCKPGTYTGTFSGAHGPSLTFVGVPFDVSGTVTLTTSGSPPSLRVAGTFDGGFNSCPTSSCPTAGVPFTMVMSGTFDCDTQTVTGTIDSGKEGVQANLSLVGTFKGSLSGSSGTWTESESPPPPIGALPGDGTGNGQWTATRSGH